MAYWLVKSEPATWSWDAQVKAKVTGWDGVRNHQAANNMKAMALGDLAFFYHSGDEKQVVGIVEVTKLYRPDPSDESGRFGMVDVKAVKPFTEPVTLAQIKAEPRLKDLTLVRNSRLSVQPVAKEAWALICKLGKTASK
jgi:predicted RNA-binding protein with PUA-like domain